MDSHFLALCYQMSRWLVGLWKRKATVANALVHLQLLQQLLAAAHGKALNAQPDKDLPLKRTCRHQGYVHGTHYCVQRH